MRLKFPVVGLTVVVLLGAASISAQAQSPARASYLADGSFELPEKGQRGGPDRPVAMARAGDGSIHIADEKGRVFVYDRDGTPRSIYGSPQLARPVALAIGRAGLSFVLDRDHRRVLVFASDGEFMGSVGRPGGGAGELDRPVDLAVGPSEYVYVLDAGRKAVQIFSQDGVFIRQIGLDGVVHDPSALAVGNDGAVYVSDRRSSDQIHAYPPFIEIPWRPTTPQGIALPIGFRQARFQEPVALAVNEFGTVVVLDRKFGRLWRRNREIETPPGGHDLLYGGIGTGRGSFREPVDLVPVGPADLMILDSRLRKVERIRLNEELRRTVARPDLDFPVRISRVDLTIAASLQAIGYGPSGPLFLLDVQNRALSLLGGQLRARRTVYGDSVNAWVPDAQVYQRHFSQGIRAVGGALVRDTVLLATDPNQDRFVIFPLDADRPIAAFGDNYRDNRRLDDPHGIAMLDDGRIVIGDTGNDAVKIFASDLASLLVTVPFPDAYGVAVAPTGEIFAWNRDGTTIGRLQPDGSRVEPLNRDLLPGPIADLTFDAAGNLFALDRETGRVSIVGPELKRVMIQLGSENELDRPERVLVDRAGNIYIAGSGSDRTVVYRWDVQFPRMAGLQVDYEGAAAVLRWPAGPDRYVDHYRVQGAPKADGPYRDIGRTPRTTFRLDGAASDGSIPRYVRVAPAYITGGTGAATDAMPLLHFTAGASYHQGDYHTALDDAQRALQLIENDALAAGPEARANLLWIAFASSYALADYRGAVRWGGELASVVPRRHRIEFFFKLAHAHLQLNDPASAAQRVLALVGGGQTPEFYRDSMVEDLTFRVHRALRDRRGTDEALAFLRAYVRAMPTTVADLKAAYNDSIAVYDTRSKLAAGFRHWEDTNYPEVVRFFRETLRTADLSPGQKVLCHEILAAAYYAFGRKEEAAAAFREIYRINPRFDLDAEVRRIRELYGLTSLYNAESRSFFDGLRPRS